MRCSRLRRSPDLPPPHIAAKFRTATTARNVRGHVLRPVVLASLEGRPPRTAGFVVRARLARVAPAGVPKTEPRSARPLRVALAGGTPRRKQNRFYAQGACAHARRLPGGDPSARRIKSCFVPCAPTARAMTTPKPPRRADAARGMCRPLLPRPPPGAGRCWSGREPAAAVQVLARFPALRGMSPRRAVLEDKARSTCRHLF